MQLASLQMTAETFAIATRLNQLLAGLDQNPILPALANKFAEFVQLLMRWNQRINLTAIRGAEGILSRHIVEGILCARLLPQGIESLLDFGSGAGFPGIPIALCRSDLAVTLAESQGKKAAFLREAVRVLEIETAVYSGRAEGVGRHFDCVTLRAVDKMPAALQLAGELVHPAGFLVVLTTSARIGDLEANLPEFDWREPIRLASGESQVFALGNRRRSVQ
jgi:16S rRNA (guanine527-N7)-methyltransferase